MQVNKHLITKEGKLELEKELKDLYKRRDEIIIQIQDARAQGDLSENADYDSAKASQRDNEKRINEVQEILDHHEIIKISDGRDTSKVKISSVVTIQVEDQKVNKNLFDNENADANYTYTIVGTAGADPEKNYISNESPLAKSLIGKEVGSRVEIRSISEPY